MNYNPNDTIAALATPPGVSALGVIRISGPEALEVVDRCFRGRQCPRTMKGYRAAYGHVMDSSGNPIDEVVIVVYRSPHSYTGEDLVEISGHGSPYVLQKILERLLESGARAAMPGEFTLRAFLNGKLDLAQAEAVADLIESSNEAQHRTALYQMRGHFSKEIAQLRERLIKAAALMELELDFAEEDVEFVNRSELQHLIKSIGSWLQRLAESYQWGRVIKEGVHVLITGRPNVGKSTLLNTLLGDDRAIVSPIAGTTRDVIEDMRVYKGIIYRFLDTAGLRSTDDAIEQMGISRMLQFAPKAHWILFIVDLTVENPKRWQLPQRLRAWKEKVILLGNKIDIASRPTISEFQKRFPQMLMISASDPTSADKVLALLHHHTVRSQTTDGTPIVNARHYDAIIKAKSALERVSNNLTHQQLPTDLIIPDLREALDQLSTITGDIVTDDILGHIFSRFCIGK